MPDDPIVVEFPVLRWMLSRRLAILLERGPVAGVLLKRREATVASGMSVDHFERRVQPFIRLVPSGQLVLVPRSEIERWAHHNAR